MTIVVANDYHAKQALENLGVYCITDEKARKQDIRPLRIGVLNIMPEVDRYEVSVLYPLGRTLIQIYPVWIKLTSHSYKNSQKDYIDNEYVSFADAIKDKRLDGLIVTGAPVETIKFEDVRYWDEIKEILTFSRKNIASTLGMCWGGLALAKMLGIEKTPYREKLFGVFETRNIAPEHRITGRMDDLFYCPQSRYAGIDDKVMEQKAKEGIVNLLAYSEDAGYTIFESTDGKYMMHLGHPEYEPERIVAEYIRDRDKGLKNVARPVNININKPLNVWRGHCHEFYGQWIKYVYETTPF
jgi:homoserine O-succinyltransferase